MCRALATGRLLMAGPWIFFDHMGPTQFELGHGIDISLIEAGKDIVSPEREIPEVTANRSYAWPCRKPLKKPTRPLVTLALPRYRNGVSVRVIMRRIHGAHPPVKAHAEALHTEARFKASQLSLPSPRTRTC